MSIAPNRSSSCFNNCVLKNIVSCGTSSLNTTAVKVILLLTSLLFIAFGAYGASVAPHMWGSYVVISMGIAAFATTGLLVITKICVSTVIRNRPR